MILIKNEQRRSARFSRGIGSNGLVEINVNSIHTTCGKEAASAFVTFAAYVVWSQKGLRIEFGCGFKTGYTRNSGHGIDY